MPARSARADLNGDKMLISCQCLNCQLSFVRCTAFILNFFLAKTHRQTDRRTRLCLSLKCQRIGRRRRAQADARSVCIRRPPIGSRLFRRRCSSDSFSNCNVSFDRPTAKHCDTQPATLSGKKHHSLTVVALLRAAFSAAPHKSFVAT